MSKLDFTLGKLEINGQPLDLQYFLGSEYTDIREASEELPAVIEWINSELQVAVALKVNTKFAVKQAEARAYFQLKDGGFERAGYGEKMTEKALEHAVNLDKGLAKAVEEFANATAWVTRLSNLLGSLQAKLELVRSTEATSRRLIEAGEDRDDN